MGVLDKYLSEQHEEAKEDFDKKGDEKYGKDDDDKIGRIHDMLKDLWEHTFNKKEYEEDKKNDANYIKEGAKDEEKEIEEKDE